MKFHFPVYLLFSVSLLITKPAGAQITSLSTPEERMTDFVNRFLSQYTNAHLRDQNDQDLVKTYHIKSIQTYHTDCADHSKKSLKNACFYDSLGRLVEQVASEHSTNDRVTYTYNTLGQLEEKNLYNTVEPGNPNGHLKKRFTFSYDDEGKLVKIATLEILDELPHDHGAHYFQERPFYSFDTIVYDFVNLKITVHHREADRYLVLATENTMIETVHTNTFTFDMSGRVLERKYTDNNRNIHFTDHYTDCWNFVTNSQLRDVFMDTCQWVKNHVLTPEIIPDNCISQDSLFFEENAEKFVKYTFLEDNRKATVLSDNICRKNTQRTSLIYDQSETLREREVCFFYEDTIGCSQQFIYDKSGRLMEETSFSSAGWLSQFGFMDVSSSISHEPVDIYRVTTYEYHENGIVKRIKVSGKYENYSSCEETFIEYY